MRRESVARLVIHELSSCKYFFNCTVDWAIEYVCHRYSMHLASEDREYVHNQVLKFFKEGVDG